MLRKIYCWIFGHNPKCLLPEVSTSRWQNRRSGCDWCVYCGSWVPHHEDCER
jgi:hypothetical protein